MEGGGWLRSPPAGEPVRRVRFSVDERDDGNRRAPARTLANQMPWTDLRGVKGAYTGQVSDRMRPDGRGALLYDDGRPAMTCIWRDGAPVRPWTPKRRAGVPKGRADRGDRAYRGNTPVNKTFHGTFLPHLDIGDAGSSRDMIPEEPGPREVESLRTHDFAFVRRSDGRSWTYAMIANRTEDCILFVVDVDGSNKNLSSKHWARDVRLVNPRRKEPPLFTPPLAATDAIRSRLPLQCRQASSSSDILSLLD